jgi:integrase
MASSWIITRKTSGGDKRFRVEYRLGGRESATRYGGSFKRKADADERRRWINGEFAARRAPDLRSLETTLTARPTFETAARQWLASRVDVSDGTKIQQRTSVNRAIGVLGARRIDELTAQHVAAMVVELHAEGLKHGYIRKILQAAAMVLDHAGLRLDNPARDKLTVRMPRAEPEGDQPAIRRARRSHHRLLPSKHRLALLWLDWSGARVSSIDLTLVGDYDEPRRRIRLRAATTKTRRALWVELPDALADAIEATLPPREDRNPEARLFESSGADALRTSIAKACRAAAIPLWSPHDLRHRRISLLHLRGVPWARIGEFVGQRNLAVTANTYSHVLTDERELDYVGLLPSPPPGERLKPRREAS